MPYADDEEEILAFLRSEQEAYYRGDVEAFYGHWHHGPETRRIISGPQVGTRIFQGWEQLGASFEEGFRQYPQDLDSRKLLRWDNIQIQVAGDMAWISYDQVTLGDAPEMHNFGTMSHEIKIVQRFGGAWKVVCMVIVYPGIGQNDAPRIELAADGTVVGINALARDRLASHPGLTISGNRPRARNRSFDPGLQTAIKESRQRLATDLPAGLFDGQDKIVPLGEDTAGQPLFCWVFGEQERVLISFDNDFLLQRRLKRGGALFALSPAQLSLAKLLASGHDLTAAAAVLGISVNTVRTQIRRMFEKTSTHNQAALVSRLLNIHRPR